MSTSHLSRAFDTLERDLLSVAERLATRTARRRRRRLVCTAVVSSLLAVTGVAAASGLVDLPITPSDDPTSNHAASALGLSTTEAAVLLKAQQLGKAARDCQIAHGATPINGGLDDPGYKARDACKAQNDANESYLDSAAFKAAMVSAQPRILEAARCFERFTGVKPGTMVESGGAAAAYQAEVAAANAACYQANGLPK